MSRGLNYLMTDIPDEISPTGLARHFAENVLPFPIVDSWLEPIRIDDDVTPVYEPHVVPFLR